MRKNRGAEYLRRKAQRGYAGPFPKHEARIKQIVIATRRDEATGVLITVLAGPPERPKPKAKPWCGII